MLREICILKEYILFWAAPFLIVVIKSTTGTKQTLHLASTMLQGAREFLNSYQRKTFFLH